MPKFNVDLQRSKEEILQLKTEAEDSDSPESTIVASTLDWLFDSSADSPLELTITDDDEDEELDDEDFDDDLEDDDLEEEEEEDVKVAKT